MHRLDQLAQNLVPFLKPWFLSVQSGYAEGNWTPAFVGSGTAGTMTYSAQEGTYTRIGNLCSAGGYLAVSSISGAPTGTIRVTGLPFPATGTYTACALSYIHNWNLSTGSIQLVAHTVPGFSFVDVVEIFDNANAVGFPAGSFQACSLMLHAVYQVAS